MSIEKSVQKALDAVVAELVEMNESLRDIRDALNDPQAVSAKVEIDVETFNMLSHFLSRMADAMEAHNG